LREHVGGGTPKQQLRIPRIRLLFSTREASAKGSFKISWDIQGWSLSMPLKHQRVFGQAGH